MLWLAIALMIILSGCVQQYDGSSDVGEEGGIIPDGYAPVGTSGQQGAQTTGCDSEDTGFKRDMCLYNSAVASIDAGTCAKITDLKIRDGCYSRISLLRKDHTICAPIVDDSVMESCLFQIATMLNRTSICSSIERQSARDSCHYAVALNTLDKDACLQITVEPDAPTLSRRNTCLYDVGRRTNNAETCAMIPDSPSGTHYRDTCFREIAAATKNPSVCSGISDDYLKRSCVSIASG